MKKEYTRLCFCGSLEDANHFHKLKIVLHCHLENSHQVLRSIELFAQISRQYQAKRSYFLYCAWKGQKWPFLALFQRRYWTYRRFTCSNWCPSTKEVISHTCRHGYTCASYLWLWHEVYLCGCWLAGLCTWHTDPESCVSKFPSFFGPSKGIHGSFLSHQYFYCHFLWWFSFIGNIISSTLVIQTKLDILPLSKEARTIYQYFNSVLGIILRGSMRCSISCIHPFVMTLSGLLESWSRSSIFWRAFHVSLRVLRSISL